MDASASCVECGQQPVGTRVLEWFIGHRGGDRRPRRTTFVTRLALAEHGPGEPPGSRGRRRCGEGRRLVASNNTAVAFNSFKLNSENAGHNHTVIRSNAADDIATTVGGNRYGWFTYNNVADLAIDNPVHSGVSVPESASLALLGLGMAVFGALWVWFAVHAALRGSLMESLRSE